MDCYSRFHPITWELASNQAGCCEYLTSETLDSLAREAGDSRMTVSLNSIINQGTETGSCRHAR
jgi:hypothetical protein